MTSVHLAEKNDTLPNPQEGCLSLTARVLPKVDVKEAAARVGGEQRAAKLRLLQHTGS